MAEIRDAELKRRADFLDPSTEKELMIVIDEKLIGDHQKRLAQDEQTGFNNLLSNFNLQATFEAADVDDLSRAYRMFQRLQNQDDNTGVGPLAVMCREFIVGVRNRSTRLFSWLMVECSGGEEDRRRM